MKLSPQNSIKKGQYTKGFLEWEMASLPAVQHKLDRVALAIASRAEVNLDRAHRADDMEQRDGESPAEGHQSFIDIESGDIDRFISFNHPGGDKAAHAIEGGTTRSPGIHVLEDAARLPRQKGLKVTHRR